MLALGDTNYDKFCHMGKSIDKRCAELGGVRVADLVCADEATNLEEQVTLWKSQTMSTLQRLRSECDEGAAVAAEPCSPRAAEPEIEEPSQECSSVLTDGLPPGVRSVWDLRTLLCLEVDLATAPDSSLLPRARKVCQSGMEVLCAVAPDTDSTASCHTRKKRKEWSVDNPFYASVNCAKWITPSSLEREPLGLQSCCSDEEWEGARDVASVELNISQSDFAYLPGDSVAICVPNPAGLVHMIIARLNAAREDLVRPETVVRMADGEELTLTELLTYRYGHTLALRMSG